MYPWKGSKMYEPKTLQEFVGQPHIKEELEIAIENSRITNSILGHTVLLGPPGYGKTTLATIIGNSLNYRVMELFGGSFTEETMDKVIGFISKDSVPAIIFIDEIHAIKQRDAEFLYVPMENFKQNGILIPPFCVIGATTEFGKVIRPLRRRFRHQFRLKHYGVQDIVKVLSNRYCPLEISKYIAPRSRLNPSEAINRWKDVLMEFTVQSQKKETLMSVELAKQVFDRKEIDNWGLDATDRAILNLLYNNHSFETAVHPQPTGIDVICVSLDLSRADYLGLHEPFLLQLDLIRRQPRGRVATQKAIQFVVRPKDQYDNKQEEHKECFETQIEQMKKDGKLGNMLEEF